MWQCVNRGDNRTANTKIIVKTQPSWRIPKVENLRRPGRRTWIYLTHRDGVFLAQTLECPESRNGVISKSGCKAIFHTVYILAVFVLLQPHFTGLWLSCQSMQAGGGGGPNRHPSPHRHLLNSSRLLGFSWEFLLLWLTSRAPFAYTKLSDVHLVRLFLFSATNPLLFAAHQPNKVKES